MLFLFVTKKEKRETKKQTLASLSVLSSIFWKMLFVSMFFKKNCTQKYYWLNKMLATFNFK